MTRYPADDLRQLRLLGKMLVELFNERVHICAVNSAGICKRFPS